jgi:hypothetical protein
MITLLVLAVLIGIVVMIGRSAGPKPPAVAVAIAKMEKASRKPHRHDHDDPEYDEVAERQRVAIHEAGHIVATEDARMDWHDARIHKGGGGIVHVRWESDRSKDDFDKVVNAVAIYRAGEYAEGSGTGAGSDRRNAKRSLSALPRRMRGRALTKGERQAWSAIRGRGGAMKRYAAQLNQKGRLR